MKESKKYSNNILKYYVMKITNVFLVIYIHIHIPYLNSCIVTACLFTLRIYFHAIMIVIRF